MQQYCYNCMRPLDGSSFCGYCGTDCKSPPKGKPYYLPCGTVLANRYIIGRVLGEGGFGITYIGIDTTLSKRVAVKEFYPSGIAMRDSAVSKSIGVLNERRGFFHSGVERFMFEAKSVAAFSDEEGIVDVQDYFQENNTAYIVMDYLDGENLKQYIRNHGLFEPEKLIRLLMPVMKALKDMHAKGIIHRDISPDNIMYTKKGKLKLMDFGSARSYLDDEKQIAIILKQGFAPEEQFRHDGEQGPFTDVYALCATIYTCITGTVPPIGRDRVENDTLVPPSKLGIKIRSTHEQAIIRGLAVFAKDRTPNMDVLISEFTAKAPVDIETANTITYSIKPKNDNQENPDNSRPKPETGNPFKKPETPGAPPASPNEYMNARKTTNATIIPNEEPTPQKPLWRTIIVYAVPIVLVLAVMVGGIAFLFNKMGAKKDSAQNETTAETETTFNIKDLLSGIDNTRPTYTDPSNTQPTTEFVPVTVPEPISLSEAKSHTDELKNFFLSNVEHNDSEARYGERIELRSIYYTESKSNSDIVYIVFLYRNATADYYKVMYTPAAQFSVKNGKLEYSSTFMSTSLSAKSLADATENCWLLSSTFKNQYTNTTIF